MKIFLFGDSICFGQLVSPHLTWISSLSLRLSKLANDTTPVMLQNASINGNTTRQALERMPYDVMSHQPDVLLIQFGMNDCNYWQTDFGVPRVSPNSFYANLCEMVDRAVACGVRMIFIATNHPSLKGEFSSIGGLTHATSNREYNRVIREVMKRLQETVPNIVLIDNEHFWTERLSSQSALTLEQCLMPDGIHLSQVGHRLYDEFAVALICESLDSFFQ